MPFKSEFDEIYALGIREACKAAGAHCERVDEQMFDENILEHIYNQIAKADVIVADMTGQNPNVFYETGYAHALNKRVILLTQDRQDIPFDLSHYTHIVYGGKILPLRGDLERRIRWCIENPKESLSRIDTNLRFSIKGVAIDSAVVEVNRLGYCYFNLDIHNPAGRVADWRVYNLALILPGRADFKEPTVLSAAKISDDEYIFTLEHKHNIFPFGWLSLKVVFELLNRLDEAQGITLRLFTEVGYKDYTFTMRPD